MSKTETQSEALELAEFFGGMKKSSHRWYDGVPVHEKAAAELRRLDAENKQLNVALDEWMEKTHWVQDTAQVLELGMHRADVLRARIESLDAENKALRERLEALTAPAEGLAADVEAVLTLLEEHEWAEHCAKTPLGHRLEAAITELHNEIHAAEERGDVADTLLKRATELHEKGFMPWVAAEELALSEIGIEEAAIDELIREGTYRAVDEDFFLTGADEIRSFTRAVLVHQGMLHSGLSFAQAAAKNGGAA